VHVRARFECLKSRFGVGYGMLAVGSAARQHLLVYFWRVFFSFGCCVRVALFGECRARGAWVECVCVSRADGRGWRLAHRLALTSRRQSKFGLSAEPRERAQPPAVAECTLCSRSSTVRTRTHPAHRSPGAAATPGAQLTQHSLLSHAPQQ